VNYIENANNAPNAQQQQIPWSSDSMFEEDRKTTNITKKVDGNYSFC